jgi:glycosyltransferase involved in cell wall biosynthesis
LLTELKHRAAKLGNRVRWLGPRSDVSAVMASADIYCQPNTGPEGFGLTLVEALQAGLPVVTSSFGGAAEIVDGSCGVLTPPGDASAVAAAIGELIQNSLKRARLGAAGPARASSLCEPGRQLNKLATGLGLLDGPQRSGYEAVA